MIIRTETEQDIPAIRELVYSAFKDHPHHEPGAEPTEHLIVDRLRDGGELTLSLVAVLEDKVVGHIAFSPVKIGGKESNWLGLAPVAVDPDRQNQGIGSQLIREALDILKEKDIGGFVLLGGPEYYNRFGFVRHEELVLPGVPAEYFLALPNGDDVPEGDVSYSPAFG